MDDDPLVPVEDFAAEIKVGIQTIYNWRNTGKAPRAHRIGKRLFFRRSDLDKWIAAHADPEEEKEL